MRCSPRVSVHPNGRWHFAGWCKWSSCSKPNKTRNWTCGDTVIPGKMQACPLFNLLVYKMRWVYDFMWWPRHSHLNEQIDKWGWYRLLSETSWNWIASDDDIFLVFPLVFVGSTANTQNAFWYFVRQLLSPLSQRYGSKVMSGSSDKTSKRSFM